MLGLLRKNILRTFLKLALNILLFSMYTSLEAYPKFFENTVLLKMIFPILLILFYFILFQPISDLRLKELDTKQTNSSIITVRF
jgi:hypothetical protein